MNNCYLEELPYSNLNEYLANIGKYTKASRYRIEEKRPIELSESIKELAEKYADSDKYMVEAPTESISYCYSQIIPDEIYANRVKLQEYSSRKDALIDYQSREIYKLAVAVSMLENKLEELMDIEKYAQYLDDLSKFIARDMGEKETLAAYN